jgi:hypothetical protein
MYTYNPSYSGGGYRNISVQGWPEQKCETPSESQTKSKRMRGVAQAIKLLPRKHKVLSSVLVLKKKKSFFAQ